MSYRIDPRLNIAREIDRITQEQAGKAVKTMLNEDLSIDGRIHDCRKRFKKIRAVIRLVRNNISSKDYSDLNTSFRDLGREMAPMRDSRMSIDTFNDVLGSMDKKSDTDRFARAGEFLVEKYETELDKFRSENIQDYILSQIKLKTEDIARLQIPDTSHETTVQGVKKVFKRGRKTMAETHEGTRPEKMHEWRKRTKYLWYHTRLLRDVWKPVMSGYEQSLDDLAGMLGDEHDYTVLIDTLREFYDEKNENFRLLKEAADAKKTALKKPIWRIGQKIYSESPSGFRDRILEYWNIESRTG